jgi:predicted enzyme related to lactoylglutathione lyase
VCFDPNGASFNLWQPKGGQGMDVDAMAVGAPSWFETMTSDVTKCRDFYPALFGWVAETMDMGEFQYTLFKMGDAYVAGMMQITPDMGDIPPHWAVYFTVDDADATAQLATGLGGSVVVPAQDVPGVGRFCGLRSPQGVVFFVMRYADEG